MIIYIYIYIYIYITYLFTRNGCGIKVSCRTEDSCTPLQNACATKALRSCAAAQGTPLLALALIAEMKMIVEPNWVAEPKTVAEPFQRVPI